VNVEKGYWPYLDIFHSTGTKGPGVLNRMPLAFYPYLFPEKYSHLVGNLAFEEKARFCPHPSNEFLSDPRPGELQWKDSADYFYPVGRRVGGFEPWLEKQYLYTTFTSFRHKAWDSIINGDLQGQFRRSLFPLLEGAAHQKLAPFDALAGRFVAERETLPLDSMAALLASTS
jgi:hypothetical protein